MGGLTDVINGSLKKLDIEVPPIVRSRLMMAD